jgi:hypothetical protein
MNNLGSIATALSRGFVFVVYPLPAPRRGVAAKFGDSHEPWFA